MPLIQVNDLTTRFFTEEGQVNAVESVSFEIDEGNVFGIVGESGSGKSVTALSMMDLVESPGRIVDGEIWYRNEELAESVRQQHPGAVDGNHVDVLRLPERVRRSLRGVSFGMVFQDARSSFNPSLTVGDQIAEAVEVQRRARSDPRSTRSRTQGFGLGKFLLGTAVSSRRYVRPSSRERAVELLEEVGISDAEERADEYPHQFSGGMLQRAMIAQAIAGEPDLLIADEITTALDVTIQAQILDLLRELQASTGMSILLITHDIGVVARVCDRIGVMYAGEICERGSLEDVFDNPVHPYTKGLMSSVPDLDAPDEALEPIDGNVPSLLDHAMGDSCYFADRCPKAMQRCLEKPPEYTVDQGHEALCYLAEGPYEPDQALSREGRHD